MTRKKIILALAGCAVVAIALFVWLSGGRDGGASGKPAPSGQRLQGQATSVAQGAKTNGLSVKGTKKTDRASAEGALKKRTPRFSVLEGDDLDANDASVITKVLDDLLDDDNFEAVLREAARLKTHADAEVRSRVAFALHWTGVKGLGELTSMLGDSDPDVAREALDYWKSSLAEVDSSPDKAALLSAAAQALGPEMDSETFGELLSEFSMLDEYDAVPSLVDLLKQTEEPERIQEIIDTIDPIINSDTPMETKQDVELAVGQWVKDETAAETSEEPVEGALPRGVFRKNDAPVPAAPATP